MREVIGTFFLVLVAAGGPMIDHAIPGSVGRAAAVVAPGLMVMAVILSMGKVSGAHLNPAVTLAFSLRRDFPWRRVPAYLVAQLVGALAAAWFLQVVVHVSAHYGSTYPGVRVTAVDAFLMEAVLTLGLVGVILGTASGAQQVGLFGAIGVGGYIALAGLWASPISGASMNPVRTLGPGHRVGRLHLVVGLPGRPAARCGCWPSAWPTSCEVRAADVRLAGRPGHHQPQDQPARQGLSVGPVTGAGPQPPTSLDSTEACQVDRPLRSSARSALPARRSPALIPT